MLFYIFLIFLDFVVLGKVWIEVLEGSGRWGGGRKKIKN